MTAGAGVAPPSAARRRSGRAAAAGCRSASSGPARQQTWRTVLALQRATASTSTLADVDWARFNHATAEPAVLGALADVVGSWVGGHDLAELADWAPSTA
ncbi:MAG: hypothetical protein R2690_05175 [Acidimicrobiales bacterium]